jgi:prepilin-type N-terminal cleavage/methylation domain-containing protein
MILQQIDASKPARGFTLVEVLVGILLISAFLGTAMQAIVAATAFKIRAQELSEATVWIQQDQELVRYYASPSQVLVFANDPRCSASSPGSGFAQAVEDKLLAAAGTPTTLKLNETAYPAYTLTKQSALGQRSYLLTRTDRASGVAPYHVLTLDYTVTRQGDTAPIAKIHSEIIPDAFLSCP